MHVADHLCKAYVIYCFCQQDPGWRVAKWLRRTRPFRLSVASGATIHPAEVALGENVFYSEITRPKEAFVLVKSR
jgi:hypothetical protein